MRHRKLALLLSVFALVLFTRLTSAVVFANVNGPGFDDEYDYEETARVARVSLLSGDVSLRRAGSKRWERAALNVPLVECDRLATGSNSRLEIQIDARNFIRLGESATLDIVTLRDEGVALSLVEGTATLRLARFEREREYFEIDAPGSTVAAEQRGLYRLDVEGSGDVRVTVRDGGRARISSETSGFTLRGGRTAFLRYGAEDGGDWELSSANAFDSWDTWVDDRERYLAARLRHDDRDRYYDRDVWGAEELDAYGDWVHVNDYGYVWRPHVTVINNYHNWSPYRYGRWTWCPPYGWTWVGDEPWGWAPYHYGRWVHVNNYWHWSPRSYGNHRRSWWRPALVAFVYVPTSYGEHVAWYPLGYRQPDPHARYYRAQPDRLTPLRAGDLANLRRTNPIYQRAVTSLPAREFGRSTSLRAAQPASAEIARRAVEGEPVRGRLPIRPVDAEGTDSADSVVRDRRGMGPAARPVNPNAPARAVPARPTGAATRQPGVALDNALRRERIFNGREVRPATRAQPVSPDTTGRTDLDRDGGGRTDDSNERPTGVVARPARPIRVPDAGRGNNVQDTPARVARPVRPARPETPVEDERPRDPIVTERPRDPNVTERPERSSRPVEPVRDENDAPPADDRRPRPAPPERESRPTEPPAAREERPSRPEVRERPAPEVHRPAPPREERHPDPPPQREQPEPREERPAPPPPAVHEERPSPPPREERPAPQPAPERRPDPPARESPIARPSRKTDPNEPMDN
ncbi:hypothetical protein BH18ACI2_BH18ACI2_27080 [soil metagenome]